MSSALPTLKGEIRSLTGLRGVAAAIVMLYHFGLFLPLTTGNISPIGPGYLMVDLFFVLSGFVMARTYAEAFTGGFSVSAYSHFLEARIARVYPLYIVMTVVMFLLAKLTHSGGFPTRAVVSDGLMVQNLGAGLLCQGCGDSLVSPGWSISAEVGAYLLFPILVGFTLVRSWFLPAAIVVLCAGAIVMMSFLPTSVIDEVHRFGPLDIISGTTLWPLVRCLAGFTIGLVIYRASIASIDVTRSAVADLALCALLAGLWFVPSTDLAIVALFPLLILQLCNDTSPMSRLLGSRIPYALGRWSYAIYLVHWAIVEQMPYLDRAISWPGALMVYVTLTIGVAALVFEYLEKPSRRMLRKWFLRRRRPIDAEPSAP